MLIGLTHVVFCAWLIWFDGAERMEGTFPTIFFFRPGMTARHLKFCAGLSLFTISIYIFLSGV